jgi:regulator of RNase E activity RraA
MTDSLSTLLSQAEILQLTRWNTPTIYNGWEQVTKRNAARECFNLEETRDFMPQMGPMAGYAITVVIEPGNPEHPRKKPNAWKEYREYVAKVPGPKIVVVQDLDKPSLYGGFWGEVNSSIHHALGCVGTIIDGGIRDLDEMTHVGFKALARRLCVGHAHSTPIRWNCPVEVFGCRVSPGEFIHADKHGFLAIPPEDLSGLLDAARFMDANECRTVLEAARCHAGKTHAEVLTHLEKAAGAFNNNVRRQFGERKGEW